MKVNCFGQRQRVRLAARKSCSRILAHMIYGWLDEARSNLRKKTYCNLAFNTICLMRVLDSGANARNRELFFRSVLNPVLICMVPSDENFQKTCYGRNTRICLKMKTLMELDGNSSPKFWALVPLCAARIRPSQVDPPGRQRASHGDLDGLIGAGCLRIFFLPNCRQVLIGGVITIVRLWFLSIILPQRRRRPTDSLLMKDFAVSRKTDLIIPER